MHNEIPADTTSEAKPLRARRRKRGRGSIYRRADGRWCAELPLEHGRRKFIYGKTAGECEEKLTSAKTKIAAGIGVGNDRLTIGSILARFLDERTGRVRARTIETYTEIVDTHLKPRLEAKRAQSFSPADVQAFISQLAREGMTPAMIHHVLAVLRMAMKLAVRWRLVAFNPAAEVKGPKVERAELDPLEAADTQKLLAAARAHPLGAIWMIAASLGLRLSEITGLRWKDVDLDGASLTVRHQLHVTAATEDAWALAELVPPKTKRALRTLQMSAGLVAALRERKRLQAAEKLAAGGVWEDTLGLIFTGERGQALIGASVSKLHGRLCTKAKVRRARFHDLRHGAATMMLDAGVDPATLSATLGHARVAFTLDTYVKPRQVNVDDAVARLASVLDLTQAG